MSGNNQTDQLNTPILFIVFNRPDLTKKVFAKIKEIRPKQLFIAADGPRSGNVNDAVKCQEVRDYLLSNIDWQCSLQTLFRSDNLGCGLSCAGAVDWFFEQIEEGIIIEDDCLPDSSFFVFCSEMLDRYRYQERIMHITGVYSGEPYWKVPHLLDRLISIVDDPTYQTYGFFQPKMINYFQTELMDSAGLDYSWNGLGFNRGGNKPVTDYQNNQEILGCCGGAFLCRRQAVEDLWQQAGDFFAEEFFAYCEDLDASLRLQWAGWSALFVADAIVYHKGGQTANKFSARKVFWPNRNSYWVIIRDWPLIEIIKNFHWLFLGQAGMVVNAFLRRGKLGWWAVKGKIEAGQGSIKMWHRRAAI